MGAASSQACCAARESAPAVASAEQKTLQPLPKRMRRVWRDMYPRRPATDNSFMVVVAFRTNVPMALYTTAAAEAREQADAAFAHNAPAFAAAVELGGADFVSVVDPHSRQPPDSTAVFVETDECMSVCGFEVLDLGCCRALNHPEWGTNVVVHVVFGEGPRDAVPENFFATD